MYRPGSLQNVRVNKMFFLCFGKYRKFVQLGSAVISGLFLKSLGDQLQSRFSGTILRTQHSTDPAHRIMGTNVHCAFLWILPVYFCTHILAQFISFKILKNIYILRLGIKVRCMTLQQLLQLFASQLSKKLFRKIQKYNQHMPTLSLY